MSQHELNPRQHDHVFGRDQERAGEKRTLMVAIRTAIMVFVEVTAGLS
jgi:hypothetical protein